MRTVRTRKCLEVLIAVGLVVLLGGVGRRFFRSDNPPTPSQLLKYEVLRGSDDQPSVGWSYWGTNALPTLCRALERKDSVSARWVRGKCEWLATRFRAPWLYRPAPEEYRQAAVRVIISMGSSASPTIPSLIRALDRVPPGDACSDILIALQGFGPGSARAIPAVLRQATYTTPNAVACLTLLRIGAPASVWELLQRHPHSMVRLTGDVGGFLTAGETNRALEKLADSLASRRDTQVCHTLIHDLNPLAEKLGPMLESELTDPDLLVRQSSAELYAGLRTGTAVSIRSVMTTLGRDSVRITRLNRGVGPPANLPGR